MKQPPSIRHGLTNMLERLVNATKVTKHSTFKLQYSSEKTLENFPKSKFIERHLVIDSSPRPLVLSV